MPERVLLRTCAAITRIPEYLPSDLTLASLREKPEEKLVQFLALHVQKPPVFTPAKMATAPTSESGSPGGSAAFDAAAVAAVVPDAS